MFDTFSEQDPDGRLKWETDIQDSISEYAPFLGTSIKVESGGAINYPYQQYLHLVSKLMNCFPYRGPMTSLLASLTTAKLLSDHQVANVLKKV